MAKNPVLEGYVSAARKKILQNPEAFIQQCMTDAESCTRAIHGCCKLLDLFENPPEGFNRDKVMTNLIRTVMRLAEMNRNAMAISMIVASSERTMLGGIGDVLDSIDDIVTGKKKGKGG